MKDRYRSHHKRRVRLMNKSSDYKGECEEEGKKISLDKTQDSIPTLHSDMLHKFKHFRYGINWKKTP